MGQHVNLCFRGFNNSMSACDLYEYFKMHYVEFTKVQPLKSIRSIEFRSFLNNGYPLTNRLMEWKLPKPAAIEWKNLRSLKFCCGTFVDVKGFLSAKVREKSVKLI